MRTLLLIILAVSHAIAQHFEVASIKPAKPGNPGMSMSTLPGGRITFANVTLRYLITYAWGIRDHQLTGGPGWLDSDHFDIVGKPEQPIPQTAEGLDLRRHMLQSLIAERFGVVFRRETRELPIYALVVAKGGPLLKPASVPTRGGISQGNGKVQGKGVPCAALAQMLSDTLSRTVIDRTGLSGDYDFTLAWTPELSDPAAATGPSLFTAIQEQLGLKLEATKGPVEIYVIDRVEKPSEN